MRLARLDPLVRAVQADLREVQALADPADPLGLQGLMLQDLRDLAALQALLEVLALVVLVAQVGQQGRQDRLALLGLMEQVGLAAPLGQMLLVLQDPQGLRVLLAQRELMRQVLAGQVVPLGQAGLLVLELQALVDHQAPQG